MNAAQQERLHRIGKWLGPVLVLLLLAAVLWLLHRDLENDPLSEIRGSLRRIPPRKLAACVGLTIVNYLILVGYDLLGLRVIGRRLPWSQVALASFTGFAMSYNFGAIFGGTPVRVRLYSSFGMSATEIVKLIVAMGGTFWVGALALAGAVFWWAPPAIPPALHLPVTDLRPVGTILLLIAVAYVCLPLVWRQPLRWGGHEFALPGPPLLLCQLALSAADLVIAAGSLFVVLPESVALSFPQFLAVYLLAVVAVLVTHVPGGVGVLELVILTFVGTDAKPEVLAALLAFRIIYYLSPLGCALTLLAGYELRPHAGKAGWLARQAGTVLGGVTPTVVALATMLAGGVLMFSGAAPGPALAWVPWPAVEVSHFLMSLIGGGLLVLGRGLQRRLDAAWWGAVILLACSVLLSLVRGPDYEEAVVAAGVLGALVVTRRRFYRRGSILHPSWSPGWIMVAGMALLCTAWLTVFTLRHEASLDEVWWRFAFDAHASRSLRALVGVSTVLLGFAGLHLFAGRARVTLRPATGAVLDEVAPLVARSPRTSASLALLGDKLLLFNASRTSFIMHGIQGRSWVALGDPVGPEADWNELIWRFREECDRYDAWPVFYQVAAANLPLYLDHGFSLLKLGEEARIDTEHFSLEGSHRKSLRQSRNRFQKEGWSFEILPHERVAELLPVFRSISDAWLAEKQSAEKGFSLGYFAEDYLRRFPCAVIRSGDTIQAFANVLLGAEHEEFSIDLMRYRPGSQNGLMDFLFCELFLWGQTQGYQWFNLGMAPLAGIEARQLSPLWHKFASLVYRHGDHFYGFEGLREYKNKFDPVWTPKYLATRGGLALPRILADVTALIGRKR